MTNDADSIFTFSGGSILRLNATSASSFGKVISPVASGMNNEDNILVIDVHVLGALASGVSLKVVDTASNLVNNGAMPITVTDDSALYTFTGQMLAGDIDITPLRSATLNSLASNPNSSTVGAVLERTASSSSGDLLTVQNNLAMLSTAAQVEEALSQLDPEVNAGALAASFGASNAAVNTVLGQLAENGASPHGTGVSTGDVSDGRALALWIRGYKNRTDQRTRNGVDGFQADVSGELLGMERAFGELSRFGVAGGFGLGDVDSKESLNGTKLETYQAILYGRHDPVSPWYFHWAASVALNRYEGRRVIDFSSIQREALSRYGGQQYSLYGDANYEIARGPYRFTPLVSLQYSRLHLNDYTETGADSLNLAVQAQDYDFLQGGVGVKFSRPIRVKNGTWVPELHAKWLYDFIGDEQQTISSFSGGGESFTTRGSSPQKESYNVGGGISFLSSRNFALNVQYDLERKEDYYSHLGSMQAKFDY